MNSNNLDFFHFQGQEIREYDGLISILDVVEVLGGQKNPRAAWNSLRTKYPSVVGKCDSVKLTRKDGRLHSHATPMASKQVILEILGLLPGEVGKKYREEAAKLFLRYLEGDPSLALEVFERIKNPKDKEWVSERQKGKVKRKTFVQTLSEHGVSGQKAFATITNEMTERITGKTATQLKLEENVTISRNVMTKQELDAMKSSESLAEGIIDKYQAEGYKECKKISLDATNHIMDFWNNYDPGLGKN